MNKQQLFENIQKKKSFLCVGLDTDITKIPESLLKTEHPVFEFNRRIVDATAPFTISYKPNLAFYDEKGFGIENVGTPPDVEVEQWPADVIKGRDPQLEKAIEIVLQQLKENPPVEIKTPVYPKVVKN